MCMLANFKYGIYIYIMLQYPPKETSHLRFATQNFIKNYKYNNGKSNFPQKLSTSVKFSSLQVKTVHTTLHTTIHTTMHTTIHTTIHTTKTVL